MAWFKVDDGFYSSKKVVRIPRARRWPAVGLWLIAGTWCADNLTDGYIAHHELAELGGRLSDASSLVECQLWSETASGYLFHDWADYQPTKAQVMAHREGEAERKRNFRASKGDTTPRPAGVHKTSDRTPLGRSAESEHPDPTRPDPTNKEKNLVQKPAPDYLSEFESWWSDCWRKQAKPDALKAFKAARKDTSLAVLVAGAQAYKLLNAGNDKSVMKMPAGWLRDRRWEDEQIVNAARTTTTNQPNECQSHRGYPLPCDRCARERGENEF